MKIDKKQIKTVPIREINDGSVFVEFDSYYIKTNFIHTECETGYIQVLCVDIESGLADWFYLGDYVIPVEMECRVLQKNGYEDVG